MKLYIFNKPQLFRFILIFAIFLSALVGSKEYLISVYNSVTNVKKIKPICSVDTIKNELALTFDCAWNNDGLSDVLKTLKEHNAKATFFVTGVWARKYTEDLAKIYAEGHEIGNNSQTHTHLINMQQNAFSNELKACHDTVNELLNIDMTSFRSPYSEYNNVILDAIHKHNYYPIKWNIDSLDWKEYGINQLVNNVTQNKDLKNGSIISFHLGSKYTHLALPEILDELIHKGYQFKQVNELIYKNNYTIEADGTQRLE